MVTPSWAPVSVSIADGDPVAPSSVVHAYWMYCVVQEQFGPIFYDKNCRVPKINPIFGLDLKLIKAQFVWYAQEAIKRNPYASPQTQSNEQNQTIHLHPSIVFTAFVHLTISKLIMKSEVSSHIIIFMSMTIIGMRQNMIQCNSIFLAWTPSFMMWIKQRRISQPRFRRNSQLRRFPRSSNSTFSSLQIFLTFFTSFICEPPPCSADVAPDLSSATLLCSVPSTPSPVGPAARFVMVGIFWYKA